MALEWFAEHLGESGLAAAGGAIIGVLFGATAQRSRFCLRAAVVEFVRKQPGRRFAVWLLAFSAAVLLTQAALGYELLSVNTIRQLTARASLSGAIIGGTLFGGGMILAGGCASRLLVLSATGNMRSLVSGLVFAVTGQAALRGILSPLRDYLAGLWTIDSPSLLDASAAFALGRGGSVVVGALWLGAGVWFALHSRLTLSEWLGGIAVGALVAAGWAFTGAMASTSFQPMLVHSLSFTGPSANTLMLVLSPPPGELSFDTALVPAVFLGAFLAAWLAGDLRLEGFRDGWSMGRYISGAVMMGFGGMLAGGCAVGAGVSGAAVFATVAWLTLVSIWAGATVMELLVSRESAQPAAVPPSTCG